MIERERMSRGPSSIFSGTYFFRNRSPLLLTRYPPSPRAASVIRIPVPGRHVGWNWRNSMSFSGAPARYARAIPSPVLIAPFVVNS